VKPSNIGEAEGSKDLDWLDFLSQKEGDIQMTG
jgi:hypothetical protein